ncbi:MAG: hypothetical protein KJ887_07260 [Candidatus Omnitrophica bacterium]|nr:hypothetical protein [Candidatus Omnitrophota bacterium]
MTQFLRGSFSVGDTPGLDHEEQQRRWDQTFGKREEKPAEPVTPTTIHKLVCGGPDSGRNLCDKAEGGSFASSAWGVTCPACQALLFTDLLAVITRLDKALERIQIGADAGSERINSPSQMLDLLMFIQASAEKAREDSTEDLRNPNPRST